jgi:hypothetical protein
VVISLGDVLHLGELLLLGEVFSLGDTLGESLGETLGEFFGEFLLSLGEFFGEFLPLGELLLFLGEDFLSIGDPLSVESLGETPFRVSFSILSLIVSCGSNEISSGEEECSVLLDGEEFTEPGRGEFGLIVPVGSSSFVSDFGDTLAVVTAMGDASFCAFYFSRSSCLWLSSVSNS